LGEDVFWLSLGLVLVFEGLFPMLSPSGWRRMFTQMLLLKDGQLRFFGMCSILSGCLLIWWFA
jgi:uncharacterized protein YjeT (DUF2065 family)